MSPLSCDADSALADLVADLTARLESGGALDPSAVAAEYPDYAVELRRLLPALEALAASSGDSNPGSPGPRPSRSTKSECARLASAVQDSDFGFRASDSPCDGRGRLGDFRILRELGRGGMGIVYEAEQIS